MMHELFSSLAFALLKGKTTEIFFITVKNLQSSGALFVTGRCSKLAVLRREDAMFFHHLTARPFDEIEGVLLPPGTVPSVHL